MFLHVLHCALNKTILCKPDLDVFYIIIIRMREYMQYVSEIMLISSHICCKSDNLHVFRFLRICDLGTFREV